MIPLPQKLQKNGFDYVQVLRGVKACIYEQWYKENIIAYEVFLIWVKRRRPMKEIWLEAREKFPVNEDFGKSAWTQNTWEGALNRFNALEKIRDNLNT